MDRNGLREIARRVLLDHGFAPDFPAQALAEAEALPDEMTAQVEDLRKLPWLSIDNEGTRTLDQITTAERRGRSILVRIAIADVDGLVPPGSALDRHARHNTRSVYTPAGTFPLLPERIAAGLGSLREGKDRLAVVAELLVEEDGAVSRCEIRHARVRNQAKLAFEEVADWLEDKGPLPHRQMKMSVLKKQLRLHEEAAGNLRRRRYERGALPIERWRLEPLLHCEEKVRLLPLKGARAQELIEDLMVATNEATAAFLSERGLPSLRRLVRAPERWERLVELAGGRLPEEPGSAALAAFLEERRLSDPEGYPDLAFAVLQLVGLGEYVADLPGRPLPRHFSLAVDDYAHSTAPLRRYADLATQRLLKAALDGRPSPCSPYSETELEELAAWCTRREDDAGRVENRVELSAGASLLAERIGEKLDAVVIGENRARACDPPVEGRLVTELDVGDRVRVRVAAVEVEEGLVEFSYP